MIFHGNSRNITVKKPLKFRLAPKKSMKQNQLTNIKTAKNQGEFLGLLIPSFFIRERSVPGLSPKV